MHKNTFFLVLVLAVIAALVVGVNIGRTISPTPQIPETTVPPTPTTTPQPTTYTNTKCGISLTLPSGTTVAAEASTGAQFLSADSSIVLFACQQDIPKPAIPAANIESIQVASIAGKLYHTTSAKDGTPFDALIFKHPTTSMDIYLAGLGSTYSAIIKSIRVP
jgi:hypothetical protein